MNNPSHEAPAAGALQCPEPAVGAIGAPKRQLSLLDSTCIIVGIIVGVGIYQTAPLIASCMPNPLAVLGIWIVGGVLSLAGALCYAELATTYPRQGGDYVYLNRAYGNWAGFLFAWADFIVIRPGSIAAMAFPFATYFLTAMPNAAASLGAAQATVLLAVLAVLTLTTINILGVPQGKWTQNLLTLIKVAGILLVFVVAMTAPGHPLTQPTGKEFSLSGLNLAMILVLFTYGGWNEIAYVGAEVKNPERNLLRSLLWGTLGVTLLYLLINGAFLHALGYDKMIRSEAVAVDTVAQVFPQNAARLVGALICISALGAINGMIFAGARITYAMGRDYSLLRSLGIWHARLGTPIWALLAQGSLAVLIISLAGSFKHVLVYTTAVVWTFFLLVGLAIFILRIKDAGINRPYKITGHPWTTALFCASCLFLIYSAIVYDWRGGAISLGLTLSGLPIHWFSKRDQKEAIHQ